MVGALRNMEQSEDYISKQIIKISEARDIYEKKLKDKILELNKDVSAIYE